VARDPSLRLLVGVSACSTLVEGAVDVMVVVVAIELLDLGNAAVGWLNSAWAVGGIVGGAGAIVLLGRGRLAAGLAGGCLMVGIPLVVVAGLPYVPVAVAALLILGGGYSLIETANLTLLQRLTSDDLLGRAFAVLESSYWITTELGAIIAPALVGLLGIRGALVAIGCCLPLIVALRWASLARYEAGAAIPDHAFTLLRGVPLFAPLPIGTLENLARRLEELEVPAGQVVVREGEPGDRFYVIDRGDFDVSCSEGVSAVERRRRVRRDRAPARRAANRHRHSADRRGRVRARPRLFPERRGRPPLQRSNRRHARRGAERARAGRDRLSIPQPRSSK
jgi:hypothetical protein